MEKNAIRWKAVMWDRSPLRLTLVGLISVKTALLVVLFDWSGKSLNPFDLTKSLASRTLEWPIAAVLALALLRYGPVILPRTPINFAVASVLITNLLSALAGEGRYIAFFGDSGRYLGVTFLVDMAILYLGVAVSFLGLRDWTWLFASSAIAFVLSGAYAWLQFAGLDPLAWTDSSRLRPFSTVGNPDTYGHFLSVTMCVSAAAALLYRGHRERLVRVAAALVGLAALAVTGIVATRGTLLGIAAGFLVVPVLYLRIYGRTRAIVVRTLLGVAVAGVLVVGVVLVSPLGARVAITLQGFATRDRVLVWEAGVLAFLDRPVLGYGPDSFAIAWPRHRPEQFAQVLGQSSISSDSAHDWIIQAAATTGLAGLAALLALVVLTTSTLVSVGLVRAPVLSALLIAGWAGYWAHALVSVGTVGVDWVPWVIAGGAAGLSRLRLTNRPARRVPLVAALGLVALAVVASSTGLRAYEANQKGLAARHGADLGAAADAIEWGEAAVRLDQGRANYWNELGRAYFAGRRYGEASDAFSAARVRSPWDQTFVANLGRALAQLARSGDASRGGPGAALRTMQEAVAGDRNNPEVHAALADVARVLDFPDVSLRASVDAYRLYPVAKYEPAILAVAGLAVDLPAARAALEQAVAVRESAALRIALGRVQLRQGDRAAALDSARRALVLQPGNADAQALIRAASSS